MITPECGCAIPVAVKPKAGLSPYSGASMTIAEAGQSQIAIYAPVFGGTIINPLASSDQGASPIEEIGTIQTTRFVGSLNSYGPGAINAPKIGIGFNVVDTYEFFDYGPPQILYVAIGSPANVHANNGTVALLPGQRFNVPVGCTLPIYVTSKLTGHRFTVIAVQPPTQAAVSLDSSFPPLGPTSKTTTIPSYLYDQYNDDPDLPAFIDAYNQITQTYVDWFNDLNLPIYTELSGPLLDWVATGLYGMSRPTLYSGHTTRFGLLNTYGFNQKPKFGMSAKNSVYSNIAVTNDDVFKRIMTWHLYRADGRNMSTQWLKRRIARFLFGTNGGDYNGDMSGISVSIADQYITITLVSGFRYFQTSSMYNRMRFNTTKINSSTSVVKSVTLPALAVIFEEAINTGALEMPEQYTTTCRIGTIGAT